jgi:hypothetical protein
MPAILAIWEDRDLVQPRQKHSRKEKSEGMAQVVEHLPRKCEALLSNSSTSKQKNKALINKTKS